ncbi:MAG: aldehyde dehydrogenase family protein [Acidimicrobiia bacterium]
MDQDLRSIQQARDMAVKAREAARAWAHASQEEVDRAIAAMSQAARRAAPELSKLAVEVTGYGRADHKLVKDLFNAVDVYEAIARLRTVGVISSGGDAGVVEIAEPMGAIAALIPTTNPVSTVFFKGLISVKARNAVVMAPHPRAAPASLAATKVLTDALASVGAPDNLIQCMSEIDLTGTQELWSHWAIDLVLATGSLAMVKAAYASGKPTYAVGPGNVPSFIHESVADLGEAVAGTITSSTFDYGTPCASEQAVIVDRPLASRARASFEEHGARFLARTEADRLASVLITAKGGINPEIVGQSPQTLAEKAGIRVDPSTTILVVEPGGVGRDYPLSMEILTSIIKWYEASDIEGGTSLAQDLLRYGGDGHTAAIWAADQRAAASYAAQVRAFRVMINTPSCFGAMGGTAGVSPSFMLGTGTWGGTITADNIGPLHLINRKRVARGVRDWRELLSGSDQHPSGLARSTRSGQMMAEDLVHRVLERLGQVPSGVGGGR